MKSWINMVAYVNEEGRASMFSCFSDDALSLGEIVTRLLKRLPSEPHAPEDVKAWIDYHKNDCMWESRSLVDEDAVVDEWDAFVRDMFDVSTEETIDG